MALELLASGIRLLAEKALFFERRKTLVVADLHFGKINHFRQAGLPVPSVANKRNAETLIDILNQWKPVRTIFLGDLFHSHYNEEWEVVGQIVYNFTACQFTLIRGNHDIMSEQQYARKGIKVIDRESIDGWILTHEPMNREEIPQGEMNMAGHIHPGALLQGKGRQAITLPCFWLSSNQLILPAFGSFTGLAQIRPAENDGVFVILENKILEVSLGSGRSKSKVTK
jgi:uncharacterized protein